MAYNIMTCSGFEGAGCSIAWIGVMLLVYLTLILRRQCNDGIFAGTNFNFLSAWLGTLLYIILMTITGEIRWGLLAGIVGLGVGGFLIGQIWDFGGGGDDDY